MGSAGFGVFRELAAHVKTTNWVLDGVIENFPLLYHYRIVPRVAGDTAVNSEKHKRYVTYWNSNPNIDQFMCDRAQASHALLLFLEYFPHPVGRWLKENPDGVTAVLRAMIKTITFLQQEDIIHFDVHFGNIVTDGANFFLTDFGLVLDAQFELSAAERRFFEANRLYDFGELFATLGWHFMSIIEDLPEAEQTQIAQAAGLNEKMPFRGQLPSLLKNLANLHALTPAPLPKSTLRTVETYRDIILLMQTFFDKMRHNTEKDAVPDYKKLRPLLKAHRIV